MDAVPEPLRGARFQTRPKEVLLVEPFKDFSGQAKKPPYQEDFLELVRRLEGGFELGEDFYRKRIDETPGELLETHGIKHLHLGGPASDVLVFAAEYDDVIILLEINGHNHFDTEPVGSLLLALHRRKMEQMAADATEPAAERRAREDRAADRRRRFREMRAAGWKKPTPPSS